MNKMDLQHSRNLRWFQKFTEICDENNIWYTATNGTLLGAIREKGPIEWDDDYDVMMTPASYTKLKKLFPSNCIDGSNEADYPLVIPKFIPDRKMFLEQAIFVDIFIVVPTTNKKVKKFRSLRKKLNFSVQVMHSPWKPYAWYIWMYKYMTWPFKFLSNKMTYKKAIEILNAPEEHDYYFSIDNPIDPKSINVINVLSFTTMDKTFDNFLVKVPVEYDRILTIKYDKYMIPNKWQRALIHTNTISIIKMKKTKDNK